MSSSSTSNSIGTRNPKFKVDLDGNLYCQHDVLAVLRVAGVTSLRQGEQFYGCSYWPKCGCKFFVWKEDVDRMFKEQALKIQNLDGRSRTVMSDSYEDLKIQNLDGRNRAVMSDSYEALKIQNLELQKNLLIEENKRLQERICDRGYKWKKKTYVFSVLIIIAICMYLSK